MEEDLKQVRIIAELARIKIEPDQEKELVAKFAKLKEYFNSLSRLATDDDAIEKNDHLVVFHEDQPQKSDIDLSFSPYLENKLFKVPKVI